MIDRKVFLFDQGDMVFSENVFIRKLLKTLIIKIKYLFYYSRRVTMLRFHLMYLQFVCQVKITEKGQVLLLNLLNILNLLKKC